jgi:hypothetical protein
VSPIEDTQPTTPPTKEDIMRQAFLVQDAIDRAFHYNKQLIEMIARGKGGREAASTLHYLQDARHWISDTLDEIDK